MEGQVSDNLPVTLNNFIHKAVQVWNKMIEKKLDSPELDIGNGNAITASNLSAKLLV